jgi:hypothetical protein
MEFSIGGKWFFKYAAAIAITALIAATGRAQILLLDNFDDTNGPIASQGDGMVDTSEYRAPFGGAANDAFVGRTQFRFTLPAENVATTAPGSADGKVAVLELSTNNPLDASNASFFGTDLITKRNYAVGGGLRMTTRMRVDAATAAQGGLVAAPFLYDVTRTGGTGLVRDEIDHELITNLASGPTDNTSTNIWNDGDFANAGSPQTIFNPAGFDISAFHDYRTDWAPGTAKYYIDNTLVRTVTGSNVPDDPMRAHWNFWAPDNTFSAAYNASLLPTAAPGTTYRVELDRVQIERLNTTLSSNLLVDGSFETLPLLDVNTPGSGSTTGQWINFNNSSLDGLQVVAQDGAISMKAFGPFTGGPNASGVFQNVAATPGQQFEGSVWAQAPSFDHIKGNQNFTTLTLQWVNAAGSVIGSVNFSPGTNQQETPIFDGRDPRMIQDEWVQYFVNGVAPAGTAYARLNLFFVQLANEGGAAWFDNAELRLINNTAPVENADFNGDGKVDGADFLIWQRHSGASGSHALGDANNDGAVNAADLAVWKSHFGGASSAAAAAGVPEPASCSLVCLGMGALLYSRRRRAR